MSKKIWLGAMHVKEEGGYEIILKSLMYYKKRLRTLDKSPELKDARGMFASILNQQAMKTVPKIDEMVRRINDGLEDIDSIKGLGEDDVSFLEKALSCYQADISKAEDAGQEYFVKLIGDTKEARKDKEVIKKTLSKIRQFSE